SGVSERAISNLERGVSQPRLVTARMLASALALSDAERNEFIPVRAPDRMSPSAFGRLLRSHRAVARLSQPELAQRALISARSVSDLERGVYQGPRRPTVLRLANALGLDGADRDQFEAAARQTANRGLTS